MKKAVIITAQNFQDEELIYPYYRLQEAGFDVDVAVKDGKMVTGKYGIPAKVTKDTVDLKEENYDLVVLPGGYEAPDRVRQQSEVLQFLRDFNEKKKIISSICHGPWIMISAGIVKNRKMTGYMAIKDDLINAGAIYIESNVVVDGNFVTSPHYKDNAVWMKETLKKFD